MKNGNASIKVTSSMNDKPMEGFTINELWYALVTLPKKSCPGEDGLPPSFYILRHLLLKIPPSKARSGSYHMSRFLDSKIWVVLPPAPPMLRTTISSQLVTFSKLVQYL